MSNSYLNSIRSRSCYPTFRGFVKVGTLLAYASSALFVLLGFFGGFYGESIAIVFVTIVFAVLLVIFARLIQEVSLMVVDIADATIEVASRSGVQSQVGVVVTEALKDGDRVERDLRSYAAKDDSVRPSEAIVKESSTLTLRTESDCAELLNSMGYKLTPRGSSWVVREPLGGTLKIADLASLLEYSNSQKYRK